MTNTVSTGTLQGAAIPRHYIDSAEIPTFGVASDKSNVALVRDTQLEVEFAAWQSQACQHATQFTGKSINSAGVEFYKRYCKSCGIATTQHLPFRSIEDTTVTLIDNEKREKLIDKYVRYRRDELAQVANRAADRAQPSRRSQYAEYLNSPEWRKLRAAIMDRCDGVCEGCRERSADDVHHLTYSHIGREFLFQLVGLCRSCHTRLHEDKA